MIEFIKMNKSLITYFLILLIFIPIFGSHFLLSFIGNVLLLLFLIPVLLFIIALLSINSLKSKVKTCYQCGTISLGDNNNCINCGADLSQINTNRVEPVNKPSEKTIEIEAEEIK